jgi:hypothetical protein
LERLTGYQAGMVTHHPPSYAGYRFPAEVSGHAVLPVFKRLLDFDQVAPVLDHS